MSCSRSSSSRLQLSLAISLDDLLYRDLPEVGGAAVTSHVVATLHADDYSIDVPGTKTRASAETIFPAPEFWPWIAAAIPSPLGYRWLRNYFKQAAREIGRPELRVHDLRRLFAKLASDAGAPTAQVQAALRHANPAMTRRYEMTTAKRDVGRLVGQALERKKVG